MPHNLHTLRPSCAYCKPHHHLQDLFPFASLPSPFSYPTLPSSSPCHMYRTSLIRIPPPLLDSPLCIPSHFYSYFSDPFPNPTTLRSPESFLRKRTPLFQQFVCRNHTRAPQSGVSHPWDEPTRHCHHAIFPNQLPHNFLQCGTTSLPTQVRRRLQPRLNHIQGIRHNR